MYLEFCRLHNWVLHVDSPDQVSHTAKVCTADKQHACIVYYHHRDCCHAVRRHRYGIAGAGEEQACPKLKAPCPEKEYKTKY
jgi:hypothetical protein